jgi:hypothetical protein
VWCSFWFGVDEGLAVGGARLGLKRGAGDGEGFGGGCEGEGGCLGEVCEMLVGLSFADETNCVV